MKKMECDVVIAGCGVAGLFSALHLPKNQKIIMLKKRYMIQQMLVIISFLMKKPCYKMNQERNKITK